MSTPIAPATSLSNIEGFLIDEDAKPLASDIKAYRAGLQTYENAAFFMIKDDPRNFSKLALRLFDEMLKREGFLGVQANELGLMAFERKHVVPWVITRNWSNLTLKYVVEEGTFELHTAEFLDVGAEKYVHDPRVGYRPLRCQTTYPIELNEVKILGELST